MLSRREIQRLAGSAPLLLLSGSWAELGYVGAVSLVQGIGPKPFYARLPTYGTNRKKARMLELRQNKAAFAFATGVCFQLD